MYKRLISTVTAGAIALVALATTASAEPAGQKLLGLLNGNEEVDANGAPNQGDLDAAGYVVATVDGKAGKVCVTEFKVAAVDGTVSLFHIHKEVAGKNGPIVVDFVPLLPSGIGCVQVPNNRRLLNDIKRAPSKFYFNVHSTPNFPAGAIRGQIRHLARN
jgi:hypothetical protein